MTKKEMKDKYQISSPGMSDCLAMAQEIPQITKKVKLKFTSAHRG